MERETRIWKPQLTELRVDEADGKKRITGLAVPYGELSEDLGGWREMFAAGAFADTLAENRDVMADVEHDPKRKLGRRQNGSVELRDTPEGLRIAVAVPDTTVGRDTLEEVKTGLLDGMSIAFTEPQSQWMGKGPDTIRKVTAARLHAVTLTSYPAYRQTIGTVTARSLAEYRSTIEGSTAPPPDKPADPPAYDPEPARQQRAKIDREIII